MGTLIAVVGLMGWALLWPERGCSEPACARKRFVLAIEVDAFDHVEPIAFEVRSARRSVSLRTILRSGGVDAQLMPDQFNLPYKAASGALDRADLNQFARAWRGSAVPDGADAKVYALLAPALVSDTGEPLFGLMFDVAERQAFAVAPAETVHQFGEQEPASVPLLQLRTFTHELLHSLNRRHLDAVRMSDGRLTLEAPTRCIAEEGPESWSLREAPLMSISPATIRFFQTAAPNEVLPGKGSTILLERSVSPTECDEARARSSTDQAHTRWELALRRLRDLFALRAAAAAEINPAVQDEIEGASRIELRIQAMPAAYPLGYPVAIRLIAHNSGDEPLPLKGRLSPSYGMVRIEHRAKGEADWHVLKPLAWYEPIDDDEAGLQPGEQTEQTLPVYFGDEGWTFPRAGEYEIRARLQAGTGATDAVSDAVVVRIEAPAAPDDSGALQPLLDQQGQLDEEIGRMLTFGGNAGSEEGLAPLQANVEQFGHTALGGALRLTLITQRLRRPIDPLTGERPAPDFGDARELLADTCSDSGIAALKWQLLQRHAGALPTDLSNRAETGATAWDGTTSTRGKSMPTYSDPSLQPWGPSLHFCLNESQLRGPVSTAMPRLASDLRRKKPVHVVIVGHGDHEGNCRYNDGLGLRRAEVVRRALVAAGVRARMDVASLGERRPLDFASTNEAHDLNRRVEILIETTEAADRDDPPARVAPKCSSARHAAVDGAIPRTHALQLAITQP